MNLAAIQMVSGSNLDQNLDQAESLINTAVKAQAKLVVLPENFAFMPKLESERQQIREEFGQGRIQDFLSLQASKNNIVLVGGTIPIRCENDSKTTASCLVWNTDGECCGRYDKIHLFDVDIPGTPNESYRESETIRAGKKIKVVDIGFAKIGLAVCYDLRFPELFRLYSDKKVDVIVLPSAFTEMTGRAHWDILLAARAIENMSYVIAANQGGLHDNNRETYGGSMIVDPWGRVLNRLAKGPGAVIAEYDVNELKKLRANFPVLNHRKL